jgi:deoxycytidylate deaminase
MGEDNDLVLGISSPVGTNVDEIATILEDRLAAFGFQVETIRMTELIKAAVGTTTKLDEKPEAARIDSYIRAGNALRKDSGLADYLALCAIAEINSRREGKPRPRTAYIIRSLKHQDEVQTLREVYSHGFYLFGVTSSTEDRRNYLVYDKQFSSEDANTLMAKDEAEADNFGQQVRKTFQLSDFFVYIDQDKQRTKDQLWRMLDLVFSRPDVTPTLDEYSMFLAYAAAVRSGDLSRQVGAVLVNPHGEVVATGTNDVPKYGGGLYWSGDPDDDRDFKRKVDANERWKQETTEKLTAQLGKRSDAPLFSEEHLEAVRSAIEASPFRDITEYMRAVHAEMETLLCAARNGVATRDCDLYCTTFPCHNCAKHIVAAGVKRVFFIEPYPKSRAKELHGDSITFSSKAASQDRRNKKVEFIPFFGVGPRRYFDLFSMSIGSGRPITRKENGVPVVFEMKKASLRLKLIPLSYIDREVLAIQKLPQPKTSTAKGQKNAKKAKTKASQRKKAPKH